LNECDLLENKGRARQNPRLKIGGFDFCGILLKWGKFLKKVNLSPLESSFIIKSSQFFKGEG